MYFSLICSVMASSGEQQKDISDLPLNQLPRTELLGLYMMPNSKCVVATGACHAPFSNAGIMSSFRIVTVEGFSVKNNEDLRRALYRFRNKKSIKVGFQGFTGLNGSRPLQTAHVKLPHGWWRTPAENR